MQLPLTEVECPICLKVFFQPVSTSCGHTFCRHCMDESLEVSSNCPLCRHKLKPTDYHDNRILQRILERQFPDLHAQRQSEMKTLTQYSGKTNNFHSFRIDSFNRQIRAKRAKRTLQPDQRLIGDGGIPPENIIARPPVETTTSSDDGLQSVESEVQDDLKVLAPILFSSPRFELVRTFIAPHRHS